MNWDIDINVDKALGSIEQLLRYVANNPDIGPICYDFDISKKDEENKFELDLIWKDLKERE